MVIIWHDESYGLQCWPYCLSSLHRSITSHWFLRSFFVIYENLNVL